MALDPGVKQALDQIRSNIGHNWGVYNTFSWLSNAAGSCRHISNLTLDVVKQHRIMY